MREQVGKAVELIAARAQKKGLGFRWQLAPSMPARAVGDPLRLRQVLMNLLANAVKFTDEGEVVLAVERGADRRAALLRARHRHRHRRRQAWTACSVRSCSSMRSFTRRVGGTGLGLSISRHLVETHGRAHLGRERGGPRLDLRVRAAAAGADGRRQPAERRLGQLARPARARLRRQRRPAASSSARCSPAGARPSTSVPTIADVVTRLRLEHHDILVLGSNLAGGGAEPCARCAPSIRPTRL